MSKRLFLFYCKKCDKDFEDFVESDIKKLECPICGTKSERVFGRNSIYFPCGGYKTGYTKPSTPIGDDGGGATARFPHYADRNTGKSLGFGKPEVLKDSDIK